MTDYLSAIERVEAGKDLACNEMEQLVGSMLAEEVAVDSSQADLVRRLLLGLRAKGETTDELVGAARAMRARMTPIYTRASVADFVDRNEVGNPSNSAQFGDSALQSASAGGGSTFKTGNSALRTAAAEVLLDTCGTGGSGSGTFNISTAAAIVVSAAGVAVAKHGNRKATSRTGSADVLAELGVRIESDREDVRRSLEQLNLCFCFAPLLHPAMRHVGAIRRSLAVPTMFNLLGPLCNPAGATHQLLGTGRADVQPKLAEALARLGTCRSVVVRGEDGQDEVSLDGVTTAIEVRADGTLQTHHWTAATFGLAPASVEAMQAADPVDSARIIREIFDGVPGPCRDIVIANAAVAFWLVQRCDSVVEGARLAAEIIDSGTAKRQLSRFVQFTNPQIGNSAPHIPDAPQNQSVHQDEAGPQYPTGPRFSERALELAAELKRAGLVWNPEPGHFVYDSDHVLPHTSPFQDRVFFILDLKHFLRYAGSVEQLKERMTWLPAWWDARNWLRDSGVEDGTVADFIHARNGIVRGEELILLYEMILERLG